MYRNLLLTESEKNEIKKLYGLLSEQNDDKTEEIYINFEEGKYKVENYKEQIGKAINNIRNFVNQNKGKIIEVTIESSESKIPNYDRENYEKRDYSKDAKLNSGELSKKRADSIKDYLNNNAKDILSFIEIKQNPVVGGPEWSTTTKDKSVYQPFQYVKLIIKAISEVNPNPKRCLINMEINFNYTDLSQRHRCNNATYKLYFTKSNVTSPTDEDLLIRNDGKDYASLDNNNSEFDNNPGTCTDPGKDDCKRYNKFIITNEIFERVGGSNLTPDSKFKIWAKCVGTEKEHQMFGTGCHYKNINVDYGIGEFKITNGKGDIIDFKVNTPIKKDIITLLSEIEPCGNPVIVKK